MTERKIVLTTTGSREEAQRIARALVDARHAACVNIAGPVESIYRWKGEIERSEEWLLIIKTTAAAIPQIQESIRLLHSYELPECIEISIEGGTVEYLAWIGEQVQGGSRL
jgi:periplasmic divalent cation tolerance protein